MKGLKALVDDKAPAPASKAPAEAAPLTRNNEPKRDRLDRAGQRLIAAHVDADTFKTFKILCAEEGATTQAMVCAAVELLFRQYHKPVTPLLSEQAKARV